MPPFHLGLHCLPKNLFNTCIRNEKGKQRQNPCNIDKTFHNLLKTCFETFNILISGPLNFMTADPSNQWLIYVFSLALEDGYC